MLKKIVAIGGGEIGRPGYPVETTKIDKEIIRLTGKKHPRLLFVPTASGDSDGYVGVVEKHFGKRLGCKVDNLLLIKEKLSRKKIAQKILRADIIYVGGGNTMKMLQVWRKTGTDKILKQAWEKGIVLSGLSAGSVCWFNWTSSDSLKMLDPKADYIRLKGLGFAKSVHVPHYDIEKGRRPALKKMMRTLPGIAIGIDNCCAIEIIDDQYRIIASKPKAQAYKTYWRNKKYHEELIKKEPGFKSISELLLK